MATIPIGPSQHGHTIAASLSDVFEVRLPANPTTGYTWQLNAPKNFRVQESYDQPDNPKPGQKGTSVFSITPIRAGAKATFIFRYMRSWEKDELPADEFVFTAEIMA